MARALWWVILFCPDCILLLGDIDPGRWTVDDGHSLPVPLFHCLPISLSPYLPVSLSPCLPHKAPGDGGAGAQPRYQAVPRRV
jgi:hypothetical protein